MDINDLKHTLALAKTGNFSAAANLRHMSQSAFSRRIQHIEEQLQLVLFERTTWPIKPTAAGLAFVAHAEKTLQNYYEGLEAVYHVQSLIDNPWRISVAESLSHMLPQLTVTLDTQRPVFINTLSTERALQALQNQQLDVAISYWSDAIHTPTDYNFIKKKHLLTEIWQPCLHQQHQAPTIGIVSVILSSTGTVLGRLQRQLWRQLGLQKATQQLNIFAETSATSTAIALAKQHPCVVWLPERLQDSHGFVTFSHKQLKPLALDIVQLSLASAQ